MPIFDYQCVDCKLIEDHILRLAVINTTEEPKFYCKKCGGDTVRIPGGCNTRFVFNGIPFSSSSQPK